MSRITRIMTTALLAVICAFVMGAFAPRPESTLVICGEYFSNGCDFGWHTLLGPGGTLKNIHGYCAKCIFGECHPACQPSKDSEEDQLAYRAIVAVASEGDVDQLVAMAGAYPQYVSLNVQRRSVQIVACDKVTMIANLPLSEQQFGTAEALFE